MTTTPTRTGLAVTATGLHLAYGPTVALRDIDLSIGAGERVAITGPSGAGKSTLLLALAGILRPDAGDVRVGDLDWAALGADARAKVRREQLGILFQYGQLVEDLTCLHNVALPLLLSGIDRREATARAHGWLERLDVGALAPQRPPAASAGQRQRVALARALVTEPAILFADEPTGALDSLAGERVMGNLVAYAADTGATLVVVTHDATVAAYLDREIQLRDGRVVSHG